MKKPSFANKREGGKMQISTIQPALANRQKGICPKDVNFKSVSTQDSFQKTSSNPSFKGSLIFYPVQFEMHLKHAGVNPSYASEVVTYLETALTPAIKSLPVDVNLMSRTSSKASKASEFSFSYTFPDKTKDVSCLEVIDGYGTYGLGKKDYGTNIREFFEAEVNRIRGFVQK